MEDRKWEWYHSVGLVVLVALVCVVNWRVEKNVYLCWFGTLGLLAVFTMVVGHGITGRFWLGWLIDERYTMSLSRLQMALWAALILSCFITAVSFNIKAGQGINALSVVVQKELWIAMGISATALVGSPLILSAKMKREIDDKDKWAVAKRIGWKQKNSEDSSFADFLKTHSVGLIYKNDKPGDACLSDLFMGEEVTNHDVVDFTRLQALFFTMILVITYAVIAVGHMAKMVDNGSPITELPALGASGLSLLAISTGVYLTRKAV